MDGRRNNKGTKGNKGGRPSKAEEMKLIKRLSPHEDLAHRKLEEAIELGKDWAIRLFFEYMYGKPKQSVQANIVAEQMQTIIERKIISGS